MLKLSLIMLLAFINANTVLARDLSKQETSILSSVSVQYNLTAEQKRLLFAIRLAEDGKNGKEMGVLLSRAQRFKGDFKKSLRLQACYAAGTIKRHYKTTADLQAFASRWAPLHAKNDPLGLNKNWLSNITSILARLSRQ